MAAPCVYNLRKTILSVFSKRQLVFYCNSKKISSTPPVYTNLIDVSKQKSLHIIGINRPEKRNCINVEAAKQLKDAFIDFEKDENATVAVLYGKGGNFCAGYDLQVVAEGNIDDIPLADGPMGPTKMFLKKPVIAAVSGYAVAGGLELALWCDLRVMEDTAVMGVFCRRFGVPLIDGGTVRLPHLIGLSRALDLILTGRAVKASEALEMGLATKVVPSGTALSNAIDIANSLSKFPQEGLKADRFSAYHATYDTHNLNEALKFESENSLHVLAEESIHGAEKFVQGSGRHGSFQTDSVKSEGVREKS